MEIVVLEQNEGKQISSGNEFLEDVAVIIRQLEYE
jgi:hypothetical protein